MMADSNEAALVTEEERPINGISLQKDGPMARAATTADVFNAVAEPRRREIIDLLSGGQEWAVNDVVAKMKIRQPAVSKHLLVLRKVGVVTVTKKGRERLYRLEAIKLKPIIDWVKKHEQHWSRDRESIRDGGYKGTNSSCKISRRALNRNSYQAIAGDSTRLSSRTSIRKRLSACITSRDHFAGSFQVNAGIK
jgi:DNA-binding transcriptional ArsR family regulator